MRDEKDSHGPYSPFSATLAGLRIFESVARHASFTRAAGELRVSQPYISNQIQELETKLRVTLFRRVGRRVYLTESGALLNSHANELLQRVTEIEREIAELREVIVGRLDLASVIIAAEYILPQALGEFRLQYPDVALNLQVYNSKDVEAAVADGRYELGITLSHSPSENLKIEKLGLDELVVVVGKRHRLSEETTVTPEALAAEALLVREPTSGTRLFIERRFSEAGVRLTHWLELNNNEVIKALVEANLGIAILSWRAVSTEVQAQRLSSLKIDGLALVRPLSLVSRKQDSLSPPARTFRSVLMGFTSTDNRGPQE
jgi:DNA-binding transcriptional LysR family regulator